MTSAINTYSNAINVNFPVTGQDNDTQEFRTNYSRIQSALNVAADEISSLQANAVNLSETNDFGNNVIKRATLLASGIAVNDGGSGNGNIVVDYGLGNYHKFSVGTGTNTFSFINWPPAGICGNIKLELTPISTSDVTINISGVDKVLSRTGLPVTYNSTSTVVWDVWTTDAGTTVIATELGNSGVNTTGDGNAYTVAGSTGMTDGFFYIPSAAGAPVGVPTTISGTVPMYYDTTNNRFYVYNSVAGAWKNVLLS